MAGYGAPDTLGNYRRMDISSNETRFLMFKLAVTPDDAPDSILIQNWFKELQCLVPTP